MNDLIWYGGALVVSLIVALLFEESRDYLSDTLEYIISFDWLNDLWELFSSGIESFSDIESSPLSNFWFWLFYACLMAGVWYLPAKFGVLEYTLISKLMYTVIFFIVDWFIVSHFQNN